MSLELRKALAARAESFQKARQFFAEKKVLEVDPPALLERASIDSHIDAIEAFPFPGKQGYLHTSPEYAMKRLLSQGAGDIYFLGHVFRKGEFGPRHRPEFTMAEWYRSGFSLSDLIEETASFFALFLPKKSIRVLSYREAFLTYADVDPFSASLASLQKAIGKSAESWGKETCLDFLLTHSIEPHLGQGEWTALTDYPPWQAAYACSVVKNEQEVAERFEFYIEGVELANGYHELSCAKTLRKRLTEENRQREKRGSPVYPLDEEFLSLFENGSFPDCSGVSVGFDRLLMLAAGQKEL